MHALAAATLMLPLLVPVPLTHVDGKAGHGMFEAPPDQVWLHQTRDTVHRSTHWVVRSVDGWFGEEPFEDSGGEVGGSVSLHGVYREDDGFNARGRFRLDVTMPNVDERVYLFFGRDDEEEVVRDRPDRVTRAEQRLPEDEREATVFAGIGYYLRENTELRLSVRSGYKPYAQARYRKAWWRTDRSRLEFRETIFLETDDGLGSTTALDYSHALTGRRTFRWRNAGTVSTGTSGLAWNTAIGTIDDLRRQRELALDALARGRTGQEVMVREYGLRASYRHPVYRDWVFGELMLGHFWPRSEDDPERQRAWAVGLGVEMLY